MPRVQTSFSPLMAADDVKPCHFSYSRHWLTLNRPAWPAEVPVSGPVRMWRRFAKTSLFIASKKRALHQESVGINNKAL